MFVAPAGVSVRVQNRLHPGKKIQNQEERHAKREQVRSDGMPLAQCPGVGSRGVPIPRAPLLDVSLIICCVTVVSLGLAEAFAGCAPLLPAKTFFFCVCVCVCAGCAAYARVLCNTEERQIRVEEGGSVGVMRFWKQAVSSLLGPSLFLLLETLWQQQLMQFFPKDNDCKP